MSIRAACSSLFEGSMKDFEPPMAAYKLLTCTSHLDSYAGYLEVWAFLQALAIVYISFH